MMASKLRQLLEEEIAKAEGKAAALERERDALRAEVARLNAQLNVRRKMAQNMHNVRREQYRQAYDNYVMLAQALARVAPDALAELRPRLMDSTGEEDKLMSRAGKAERERDALHNHLISAITAIEFLAEHFNLDMRSLNYGGPEAEFVAEQLRILHEFVGVGKKGGNT
ncbi:MAG: hypothetical protein WC657_06100 [Candidatus Paceibacterota bacterium]|jgi:hypothetical protein